MPAKRLMQFMGLSALFHILCLLFFTSLWFHHFRFKPPIEISPSVITLTMMPELKPKSAAALQNQHYFVDSSQSLPADQPAPNTRFESDANTRAASKVAGKGASDLPFQPGMNIPEFNTRDSAYTPATKQTPAAPPSPQSQQPQQPQQSQRAQASAQQPPSASTQEKLLQKEKELALTRTEPSLQPKPSALLPPPTPAATSQTSPSPPASVFTADRRQSAMAGGAVIGDTASVGSQETQLGRYKAKLYRAVGSRWYQYVQSQLTLLNVGQVRIRFFIRANGVIEKLQFMEGDANAPLGAISRRSILAVGALEPFSDALKQQLGEGYWEEITFSIY